MTAPCHFCGARSERGSTLRVPLYRVVGYQAHGPMAGSTTRYETEGCSVPRCPTCERLHRFELAWGKILGYAAIVFGIVLVLGIKGGMPSQAGFVLMLALAVIVLLLLARLVLRLAAHGARSYRHFKKYPVVQQALAAGWDLEQRSGKAWSIRRQSQAQERADQARREAKRREEAEKKARRAATPVAVQPREVRVPQAPARAAPPAAAMAQVQIVPQVSSRTAPLAPRVSTTQPSQEQVRQRAAWAYLCYARGDVQPLSRMAADRNDAGCKLAIQLLGDSREMAATGVLLSLLGDREFQSLYGEIAQALVHHEHAAIDRALTMAYVELPQEAGARADLQEAINRRAHPERYGQWTPLSREEALAKAHQISGRVETSS